MPDATSAIPIGPIVDFLATTYLGDGDVAVDSVSISTRRYNCQDNEQIAGVCPPKPSVWKVATFLIRTYAFSSSLGYVSQSFDVCVRADTDGCDVYGAFVFAADYEETAVGHDENWKVVARAVDSPYTRPSGCPDCCPRCASVAFSVSVSAPGFHRSYLVRVYGNCTFTKERIG